MLPAAYVTHCVEVTSATADSYGYPARIVTFDGSSWARTYEACRAVKIGGGSLTTGYYLGRLVRADPSGMHVYAVEPIASGGSIANGWNTSSDGLAISATGVWENTPFAVNLPSAGTYLLLCQASWEFRMTSGEGRVLIELYESGTPAAIPESVTAVQSSSTDTIRGTCSIHVLFTASAGCTVTMRAYRQNMLGVYDTTTIHGEESRVSYLKLG